MSALGHAVVLLAAGESRRLGEPKQFVIVEGEPLVRRAALAAIPFDGAGREPSWTKDS